MAAPTADDWKNARHRRSRRYRPSRAVLLSVIAALLSVGLSVVPAVIGPAAADPVSDDVLFMHCDFTTRDNSLSVRHADGSIARLLDNPCDQEGAPDVSPDGQKIAYMDHASVGIARDPNNNQIAGRTRVLWIANADGTGPHPITGEGYDAYNFDRLYEFHDSYPRWSPDGQWLVFVRVVHPTRPNSVFEHFVYKVRPDGTGLTQLTTDAVAVVATWSPDGQRIAFEHSLGFSFGQIYIVNADGSNSHPVTATVGSYDDRSPAWSPDGSRIYMSSTQSGGPLSGYGLVYFSSADGFTSPAVSRTVLTTQNSSGGDDFPRVSPDGGTIYFSSSARTTTAGDNAIQIFTISSNGGTPVQLMHDQSVNQFPVPVNVAPPSPPTSPSSTGASSSSTSTSTASTSPSTTATSATPTPNPTCAPVEFIGVRGSGEKESDFGGLGLTIQNVANTFQSRVPLAQVDHIDYEAIAVGYGGVDYGYHYDLSVSSGKILLAARIKAFIKRCATVPIVLAGYSQGAHVVGDVFGQLTPSERKHIAAVVLLGDPRFNHKQKNGVNVGNYGPFDGVYSLKQAPRSFNGADAPKVRSACVAGDPVCNSYPPNLASCVSSLPVNLCPHTRYVELGWADNLAQWAASKL